MSRWTKRDPFANSGTFDLTGNWINIDKLCDVLVATQEESGKDAQFKRKGYGEESDSDDVKRPCNCKSCDKSCNDDGNKENPFSALIAGVYGEDDDEDDFYLCEYCDALGYRQKYDAARCDSCTLCESCSEYDDGECSGCSYSVYRDGIYYRDRVDSSDILDSEDSDLFRKLESGEISGSHMDRSRFSLLD